MRQDGRTRRQGKLGKVLRQSFHTVARLASMGGNSQSRSLPPLSGSSAGLNPAAFAADLPALRFHRHHGENIRLERDGLRARRVESFCKGVLFTDRPVNVGERVCIRIGDLSTRWSGVLRVGFAAHNPSSLGPLPKYACPDLTKRPGFWAKALSDRHSDVGTTLHFYVTAGGDVHFGVDGEDVGVFFSGVDTRQTLWGLVDLYGNCTCIDMLDMRRGLNNYPMAPVPNSAETAAAIRRHHLQQQQVYHLHQQQQLQLQQQQQQQQQQYSMEQMADGISTLSIRRVPDPHGSHPPPPPYEPPQNAVPMPPPPPPAPVPPMPGPVMPAASVVLSPHAAPAPPPPAPPAVAPAPSTVPPPASSSDSGGLLYNRGVPFRPLSFHFCSGKNARLNGSSDVAWRHEEEFAQGYVFTAAPIRLGERMVVQVLATEDSYIGSLAFGLTNCDPSSVDTHELPEDSDQLLDRPEYWVCSKDVGSCPAAGDELSFTVRADGAVEFSKNGGIPSVFAHVDASLPRLWAFWDVYGNTSRIRMVGGTDLPVARADVQPQQPQLVPVPYSSSSPPAPPGPSGECIVCLERPVDCVIYSCGHMCMCHGCAVQQWRGRGGGFCPICREVIRDVIRTFRS